MMKRFYCYLPSALIIIFNLILVSYNYSVLPKELPLHFDLEGNYTSTMASWTLFIYPLVAAVITVFIFLAAQFLKSRDAHRAERRWECGMATLAACISLAVVSSTCVTLTSGTKHFFMFAEPALLIVGIAAVAYYEIKVRKTGK